MAKSTLRYFKQSGEVNELGDLSATRFPTGPSARRQNTRWR